MDNPGTQTDVLIVGAGPVGLLLANDCARRGLTFRIVEAHSGQSEHSKALAIFPRTLEVLDMAGLVPPFLEVANRVTWVAVVAHKQPLARMPFEPTGTPYPFVAMVPQDVTEKLLAQQLARKGGTIEYDTAFISAVQHDDSVTATLERRGERFEVTSRFLVGCDGAHSAVRHLLNLPFEGAQYHDTFMLADVETNQALPADEMHLCPSEFGPLAIFPMSASRRRIVATVPQAEGDAPSLDFVREVAAQRAPAGLELLSQRWSSYFRIHHRYVTRLHVGRIFIAGDAAHIHSPFGGQGMNTGMQDVWNLAWKLQLSVRGRGNDLLLESYTAERQPVIRNVIETTDRLTRIMSTRSKFAQAARDVAFPAISKMSFFRTRFVQNLSELAISYAGSPIVEGDGHRCWDDSFRGGAGIGNRFLLLFPEDAAASAKESASRFCESFPDLVDLRYVRQAGITLVRPDGYVAYAGAADAAALSSARSVLTRQTA